MKPPAFQCYADDLLAGTISMSNEEFGCYWRLLCIQWNNGFVTESHFARIGRGMAEPSLDHIKTKFEVDELGRFQNRRMEIERKKQEEYRENKRKAGKAGADARYHRDGSAMADPLADGVANAGSPSPSPSPVSTNREREADFPEANVPTWEEVKQMADMLCIPEATAKEFFEHHDSLNLWQNKFEKTIKVKERLQVWHQRNKKTQQNGNTRKNSGPINQRLHGQSDNVEAKRNSAAAAIAASED